MRLTLLSVLYFFMSGLSGQDSLARTQVQGLLEAVHDTLVYHHPFTQDDAGRQLLRNTLDTLLVTAAELPGGDSVHLASFIGHAAALQRAIGDGHLELTSSLPEARAKSLAARQRYISVYDTEDAGFILTRPVPTGTGDTIPLGTTVLQLDGKPVKEIVDALTPFAGLNDHGYPEGASRRAAYSISYGYQRLFGPRDSVLLTTLHNDGEIQNRWINLKYTFPLAKPLSKKESMLIPKTVGLMDLKWLPEDSLWHLRISSFNNGRYKRRKANYYKELKKIFYIINNRPNNGLVFDLRGNGGGSIVKAMEVLAYLTDTTFQYASKWESRSPDAGGKGLFRRLSYRYLGGMHRKDGLYFRPGLLKEQKPHKDKKRYDGKVVVLINETTFSAATMLAHSLREAEGIPIVGATSGGSINQIYGGRFRYFSMGDPGIFKLRIADMNISPWRPGTGNLVPDYEVPVTRDVFLGKRNPRMDMAVEVLKGDILIK
ncbi:MAG: hypothetical protein ACJAZ9_000718 [Neolewinella sp.]|jgi:hypothetical protein